MPKALFAGIMTGILFLIPAVGNAQFYTFEGNRNPHWQSPSELMIEAARTAVDLFSWSFHDQKRPEPTEKYVRLKHFGDWVDHHGDGTCYDTRAQIMIKDSLAPVEFNPKYPCRVQTGKWLDPYSGHTIHNTPDEPVEIDHVVALKNAYDGGAWNWDFKTRCLYGNFMGYRYHLLAVSRVENRRKGAKGPEDWMPSDSDYTCQHLQNWMAVKMLWNLSMTQEEAEAIEAQAKESRCELQSFQFSKSEISRIRRYMKENANLCGAD